MATGSEVYLCIDAYEKLKAEGIRARVVSMPSWDLFERQDQIYRDQVLPPDITARVAVEMASTMGWAQYTGPKGHIIGMHTFGASAPLKDLQKKFGFTVEAVLAGSPRPGREVTDSLTSGDYPAACLSLGDGYESSRHS